MKVDFKLCMAGNETTIKTTLLRQSEKDDCRTTLVIREYCQNLANILLSVQNLFSLFLPTSVNGHPIDNLNSTFFR